MRWQGKVDITTVEENAEFGRTLHPYKNGNPQYKRRDGSVLRSKDMLICYNHHNSCLHKAVPSAETYCGREQTNILDEEKFTKGL